MCEEVNDHSNELIFDDIPVKFIEKVCESIWTWSFCWWDLSNGVDELFFKGDLAKEFIFIICYLIGKKVHDFFHVLWVGGIKDALIVFLEFLLDDM